FLVQLRRGVPRHIAGHSMLFPSTTTTSLAGATLEATAAYTQRPSMNTVLDQPADLLSLVGKPLGSTDWMEITQEQVNLFADATGDHQWIHIDPARAINGPFKGTVAHGYLTLSLAPAVISRILKIRELTAALNYGVDKVRFPAPLRVGSQVRATVSV